MFTKKFEKRNIALYGDNLAILKLWGEAERSHCKEPIFAYSKEEHKQKEGPGNGVLSWTCDLLNIVVLDQGKYFVLKHDSVELDVAAYDFIQYFEDAFINLTYQLKLTSSIDQDLNKDDEYINHPLALLKETILRMIAHAISRRGSTSDFGKECLDAFNHFYTELLRSPLAYNSFLTAKVTLTEYTELITQLDAMLSNNWIDVTEQLMKSVKEVNRVKNTIETNFKVLVWHELMLQRHLYVRLLKEIRNDSPRGNDLLRGHVKNRLLALEAELLQQEQYGFIQVTKDPLSCSFREIAQGVLNTNSLVFFEERCFHLNLKKKRLQEIVITDANKKEYTALKEIIGLDYRIAKPQELELIRVLTSVSGEQALVSNSETLFLQSSNNSDRIDTLCTLLRADSPHTKKIQESYQALIQIRTSMDFLKNLAYLSNDLGSLLFLFNTVNAELLSKIITNAIEDAKRVCVRDIFIQKLALPVLNKNSNGNFEGFQIAHYDFKDLNNDYRRESFAKICRALFFLKKSAEGYPNLVNLPTIFKINESPLSAITYTNDTAEKPKRRHKNQEDTLLSLLNSGQGKIKSLPAELHEFQFYVEGESSTSILKALGLTRQRVLQNIERNLMSDEGLFTVVGSDALHYFKENPLPALLGEFLEESHKKTLLEPEIAFSVLCDGLREEVKYANLTVKDNSEKGKEFLLCIQEQHPTLFEKYSQALEHLKGLETQRKNLLLTLTKKDKKFVQMYFKIRYLEGGADFSLSESSGLLTAILSTQKLCVQLWRKNAGGELIRDKCINKKLASNNPLLMKHVLWTPNSDGALPLFQSLSFADIHFRQGKKELKQFLTKLLSDNRLNNDTKKAFLECVIVDDAKTAQEGLDVEFAKIKQEEHRAQKLMKSNDVKAYFENQGIQFVLEGLKKILISDPGYSGSKIPMQLLGKELEILSEKYGLGAITLRLQEFQKKLTKPIILHWNDKSYFIQLEEDQVFLYPKMTAFSICM
jgi:hypothetical protein